MNTTASFAAAVLLAFAVAAPAAAEPRISGTTGGLLTAPSAISGSLQVALNRINDLRRQVGAAPLAFNSQLSTAAKAHAVDMAAYDYFSHTGRDGRTPGQRIAATGYTYAAYGETIAWGYADWTAAIAGWMGSPGHRAILLDTRYRGYRPRQA